MRGLAIALVVAGTLGACGGAPGTSSPAPPNTRSAPTPTTGTSRPAPTSSTAPAPSAYDALASFVDKAGVLDAQLRHAAVLINGAGPPWTPPLPAAVASAVEAADLGPVAAAIPAGLTPSLLARTVLVYSDLASRRYAMRWFGHEGFPYEVPAAQRDAELSDALGHGAPAAARFSSDLAALVQAARAAPPVVEADPTSRPAAEVALLVEWVNGLNGGCASTGGSVVTSLPEIVWAPHGEVTGTIGGVGFKAELVDGTWQTILYAC